MFSLPNIGLFDLSLSALYVFLIYFIAILWSRKLKWDLYQNSRFFLALTSKIIGSIVFVLISMYYYKSGDTFLYFQIAKDLRTNMDANFNETVQLIFTSYGDLQEANFNPLEPYSFYYERTTTWLFSKIVFGFYLLGFGSYLVTSILFSLVSFLGLWLGYKNCCRLFPNASKLMLIPFFLIPTALIWNSGILKDTLVMGSIGILLYSLSNVFIFKHRIKLNILFSLIGFITLQALKPIFLIVFIPCIVVWILPVVTRSIINRSKRLLLMVSMFVAIMGTGYLFNKNLVASDSKYRIDNLFKTLQGFQSFHSMETFSEGQSVYTLGGIMSSPVDVVMKIPDAIVVTFFRPFVWEVKNLPLLFGTIESLTLLIFFLFVLITLKKQLLILLIKNNNLRFLFLFSIMYAVVVGISSYNFGALSRYKSPAVLFFLLSLVIMLKSSGKQIKTKLLE